MYRHQIKLALDEGKRRLQAFNECETCRHRNDEHLMNCMECCPVRRKQQEDISESTSNLNLVI